MKGTIIFDLEGTLVDVGGTSVSHIFITEDQLLQLSNTYDLAIVTGAARAELEYVLNNTFLGKYFATNRTITKDDVSESKSTGAPFQHLLDKGLSQPSVILGDSEGDRLGSAAVGVPFVEVHTISLANDPSAMVGYITAAIQKLM